MNTVASMQQTDLRICDINDSDDEDDDDDTASVDSGYAASIIIIYSIYVCHTTKI